MMCFPRAARLKLGLCFFLFMFSPAAMAQFKEIGPAPFSAAVARQRMRTLLDQVDPGNRKQTIDALNALTPWFRNILDEELIAAWKNDSRERLTLVMEPLADERVATGVLEFSWNMRTDAVLNPAYAPILGHLMARYPESGKVFLTELLAPAPPDLSPTQAEAVCRILLDMPDTGDWRQSALRILPRYRATAEQLLMEDRQGDDQEKRYQAQIWLAQLRGEAPGVQSQVSIGRRRGAVSPPDDNAGPTLFPPPGTTSARSAVDGRPETTASNRPMQPAPSLAGTPAPAQRSATSPASLPPSVTPPPAQPTRAAPLPAVPQPYNGAMSGTLECSGGPVPQHAEYVFRNLPLLKINLDYDQKVWQARLVPGESQTQRLILKNVSSGPQKRCVVHWSAVP
jgi:hypothetical protein